METEEKIEPPKPNAENLAKAVIIVRAVNQWFRWREGDWVFSLGAGLDPMASRYPVTTPSNSLFTPIESALLEEVEKLRREVTLLHHEKQEAEQAILSDIMAGGDGNLPQNNEEAVARILGDSAQYQHVKKLTALLDAGKNGAKVST